MSVAIGKLRYAAPAWYGFTSAEDRERLEVFLRMSNRTGYCAPATPAFSSMCTDADKTLFASIRTDSHHVLHKLLPPMAPRTYYNLHPQLRAPAAYIFPS